MSARPRRQITTNVRLSGYLDHAGRSLGIQHDGGGGGDQEQLASTPYTSAGQARPPSGGPGLARPDLPWDLPALAESDHDDSDEESDEEFEDGESDDGRGGVQSEPAVIGGDERDGAGGGVAGGGGGNGHEAPVQQGGAPPNQVDALVLQAGVLPD